jgi:hypothetical protein
MVRWPGRVVALALVVGLLSAGVSASAAPSGRDGSGKKDRWNSERVITYRTTEDGYWDLRSTVGCRALAPQCSTKAEWEAILKARESWQEACADLGGRVSGGSCTIPGEPMNQVIDLASSAEYWPSSRGPWRPCATRSGYLPTGEARVTDGGVVYYVCELSQEELAADSAKQCEHWADVGSASMLRILGCRSDDELDHSSPAPVDLDELGDLTTSDPTTTRMPGSGACAGFSRDLPSSICVEADGSSTFR